MSLAVAPNTTFDIYREGNAPPALPDVVAAAGHLSCVFRRGMHRGRLVEAGQRFSHILLAAIDVDVRDIYDAGGLLPGQDPDTIYIPDRDGNRYRVAFVERRLRGTAADHLRVYLSRCAPNT